MNNQEKIKIDEGVYLKRDDLFGKNYRLIYPLKHEDGSWNKFNLCTGGSYWNLIKVIILVILMVSLPFIYKHDMSGCVAINEKLYEQCMAIEVGDSSGGYDMYDISDWFNKTKEVDGDGVG